MYRSIENTNLLKLMIIAALSALFLFTSCGGGGGAALPEPEDEGGLEEPEAPADEPEAPAEEPEEPGEEPEEPGVDPEPEPEDPEGPIVELDPEILEHMWDIDLDLGENEIDHQFYGKQKGGVEKGVDILGTRIDIPGPGYAQYNFAGIDDAWHIKEVELLGFGKVRMAFWNPDTESYLYGPVIDLDADQKQLVEVIGVHTDGQYAWMRLLVPAGESASIYGIKVFVEPEIVFELPEIEVEIPELEWGL